MKTKFLPTQGAAGGPAFSVEVTGSSLNQSNISLRRRRQKPYNRLTNRGFHNYYAYFLTSFMKQNSNTQNVNQMIFGFTAVN